MSCSVRQSSSVRQDIPVFYQFENSSKIIANQLDSSDFVATKLSPGHDHNRTYMASDG